MLKQIGLFFYFMLLVLGYSHAQKDSLFTNKGQFNHTYENDVFTVTDMYYTQGVKYELIHSMFNKIPTAKLFFDQKKSTQNIYGLSLNQYCFTPRSIRYDTIMVGERPYSGAIFLSHFLISTSSVKKQRISTKLDLGLIGPCAFCEQEQKAIHKALKNIQPLGWEFQLKTDLILNYSLQFDKSIISDSKIEFIAMSRIRLGTMNSDLGVGYFLRIGKMNGYFYSYDLIGNRKRFQAFFYTKAMANFIAYNSALQGGFFREDVYTLKSSEISRAIATMTTGFTIIMKKFSFGYAIVWISPEFSLGIEHSWGQCNLSFGF